MNSMVPTPNMHTNVLVRLASLAFSTASQLLGPRAGTGAPAGVAAAGVGAALPPSSTAAING
jgi:hypothetical protein